MLQHLIHWLESWQATLVGLGWTGLFAFAVLFAATQMAAVIPGSPLGMAAGFFFGFFKGWIAVTIGVAIASSVNFLISRHIAREAVARRLENNAKFRVIDSAIGRGGWKIVALLRFVPIPFGIANYAYGITPVRFWPYFGATMLATIPANMLFVSMGATFQGSLATLFSKDRPHSPLEFILPVAGLVAAVLAFRYITKLANAALKAEQAASDPSI
jgi:uncharacterized membrane protein YdjX (TVP38/TMEM64 family)